VADAAAGRDARWDDSDEGLVAAIRDEIVAAPEGRITFARFMERALTESGSGYYATSHLRPTREGDFLTAPELHPLFGRCVGRFLAGTWQQAGRPPRYVVQEHGGGRGRLRDDVLAGLRSDGSALLHALVWQLVDLPGRSDATDEPADVILANEYLDALPVHRLVRRDGSLQEAWVGWRDGWFHELLDVPSSPDLLAMLEADGVVLRDGQRAEVCPQASRWMASAATRLAEGGLLVVIDYGHDAAELYGPRRMDGSLLTYRSHTVSDDPFAAVGRSDITAHVDVSAIERAAREAGLELRGRTSQARFLAALGLGQLLSELGHDPATDPQTYLSARSAVARLVDPRHLGSFVVLAWQRPSSHDDAGAERSGLPGFGTT
jgi:SAM-dependent MidA family methyltransferase